MRILSRKIWRAFPELDQFDDETCQRYMNRSTKAYKSKYGCMLLVFVLVVTEVLWHFVQSGTLELLYDVLDTRHIELGLYSQTFVILVAISGFLWFPWVSVLLVRDRLLHRSIRKQLRGALCKECEYSLLGLEAVIDQHTWKYVRCPECGTKNEFETGVLAPADIDPTLLAGESP